MGEILKAAGPELDRQKTIWGRRYKIDPADADALVYDGILKALDNYKPSRGKCKFYSFLCTILTQIVGIHLHRIHAMKRDCSATVSLDDILDENNTLKTDSGLRDQRFIEDRVLPDDPGHGLETRDLISKVMVKADPIQVKILRSIRDGFSFKEIAQQLGLSLATVGSHVRRLRKVFKEEGE